MRCSATELRRRLTVAGVWIDNVRMIGVVEWKMVGPAEGDEVFEVGV